MLYVLALHSIILFGFWFWLVKQIVNQILFWFIDCPCYINLNSYMGCSCFEDVCSFVVTGTALKSVFVYSLRTGYLNSLFVCMWPLLVSCYSSMFTVKLHAMYAINYSKNIFLSCPNLEWMEYFCVITYNNSCLPKCSK